MLSSARKERKKKMKKKERQGQQDAIDHGGRGERERASK